MSLVMVVNSQKVLVEWGHSLHFLYCEW